MGLLVLAGMRRLYAGRAPPVKGKIRRMRVRAGLRDDAAMRRQVARSADRLRAAFGRPRPGRALPPIDELVLTILSQNTSDTNSGRAFASLRRRFPSWKDVARAPRRSIEAAIRAGGLARLKSGVILDTLRRIERERGGFDLGFLERVPVPEAIAWLTRFRGVGEKTACCVLLFGCRRPAFPVDTHVLRVARRLGWIPSTADATLAHGRLAALVPAKRYYEVHVNLITLGRRLCRPRQPRCAECPLDPACRHAGIPHL
jgi:endonuclease III